MSPNYLIDTSGDKQEDECSELKQIKAGVPQGSVLGPVLFLLYTGDLSQPEEATVATFADDTVIMAVGDSVEEATKKKNYNEQSTK
jgi:hypothetical protein